MALKNITVLQWKNLSSWTNGSDMWQYPGQHSQSLRSGNGYPFRGKDALWLHRTLSIKGRAGEGTKAMGVITFIICRSLWIHPGPRWGELAASPGRQMIPKSVGITGLQIDWQSQLSKTIIHRVINLQQRCLRTSWIHVSSCPNWYASTSTGQCNRWTLTFFHSAVTGTVFVPGYVEIGSGVQSPRSVSTKSNNDLNVIPGSVCQNFNKSTQELICHLVNYLLSCSCQYTCILLCQWTASELLWSSRF